MDIEIKRIESEEQVSAYISNLRYAIKNGEKIDFQKERKVDEEREIKYTNAYTVADLFPNENPAEALKRELLTLTTKEYMHTIKDTRFRNRSDMRVFGKKYRIDEDVYIKIRVELMNPENANNHTTFVMSFHFAEVPFKKEDFPYLS